MINSVQIYSVRVTIYRPGWSLVVAAVKVPTSIQHPPVCVSRHEEVHTYRPVSTWSPNYPPALEMF